MPSRPAIVDLRDLDGYRHWSPPLAIASLLDELGLVVTDPPVGYRRFTPPPVVIVVGGPIERWARWLREAKHVFAIRDPLETDAPSLEALPDLEIVDRRDARAAIERAVALANTLEDSADPPPRAIVELPQSSWTAYTNVSSWRVTTRIGAGLSHDGDRFTLFGKDLSALDGAVGLKDHASRFLGEDPNYPVAWNGVRMRIDWQYRDGPLCRIDHEYPCGPAKKLWGYSNNDPTSVSLAPDASLFVGRFEHDVLVSSAVPMSWSRAGQVDVAVWPRDRRRCVLFAQDDGGEHIEDDPLDEDFRELPPTVVIGPACYAVDLTHHVYRITRPDEKELVAKVGGPFEGFVVCDLDHAIVRRGSGQLCGGWFRYATIAESGSYWREDLVTGERTYLGSSAAITCRDEPVAFDAMREGRFADADRVRAQDPIAIEGEIGYVAVPGTRNVIAVADKFLRVI